jgi:serine/threonine protein phosphatase 1
MQLIKRLERNTKGRDLIVGDIHGYFSKLQAALDAVGFSPDAGDRLISVGDLVDRGPESDLVLDWIGQPWFHPVLGNHEDLAIKFAEGDLDPTLYVANGGAWAVSNPVDQRNILASAFAALPIAIEIETEAGLVGVVHAACPAPSWTEFAEALRVLEAEPDLMETMPALSLIASAIWSRDRFQTMDDSIVEGVRAVVVGHTPMDTMSALGNTLFIDTGAWLPEARFPGRVFTVIDAATLDRARMPAQSAADAA